MTLPIFTNAKTFSETMMNGLSAALLACYDWARGPVFPFEVAMDGWAGYILHTSNTFRYSITRVSGTILIKMDGTTIKTINSGTAQSGTIDLTGFGFTIGTVYSVTVTTGTNCRVWWLGETKTITYTTPPTFTDTNVLTAANLETLRTAVLECQSALDFPLAPFPMWDVEGSRYGSNDYMMVGRYSFTHVHDTLRYRVKHHCRGNPAETKIYLNGTQIYKHSGDEYWLTGTVDLSALSLTKGNIYVGYVTVEPDGTAAKVTTQGHCHQLTEESSVACTPPPLWAQGGTNVSAANMTTYGTIIDAIHPAAAAPTLPLYYEQAAIMTTGTHDYRIQHRRRWLRYVPRPGTPQIMFGPNQATKFDLPSGSGNISYDLSGIPGLVVGQWYQVHDCEYAQEWTSQQP